MTSMLQHAGLIVRAATVRTMEPGAGPVTSLAVRDGRIAAVAGPGQEGDLLAAWRGPLGGTRG